ncbi:unnamed protein product [Clonostachys solani]|uniref:Uncharacterized protein n=1 Tax=Clonostachys solani TaxID=160281 RepID=A0A9N9Z804_9HYPO|nr:unnamed protein product [Clonostachys solani]
MAYDSQTDRSVSPIQSICEESITAPSAVSLLQPSIDEPTHEAFAHEAIDEVRFHHQPSPLSRTMIIITDIFALALGFGHFVFVCLVASYHGRPIDFKYGQFQAILTTAAPIFPMVFAFIMGRLFYHSARLQLEMGSSLGTLEQLIGSQTLGGAAALHLKTAAFNPLAVLIFALWSFSPLGSQSLLRILHQETPSDSTTFVYLNTQKAHPNEILNGSMKNSYIRSLNSDVNIAAGPTDPWGNTKIPFLQPAALDLKDNQSWHELPKNQTRPYSALFGVPISHLMPGNSMISIETTYLDLDCEPFETKWDQPHEVSLDETKLNQTALEEIAFYTETMLRNYTGVIANGSWYGYQQGSKSSNVARWNIALDRFIGTDWLAFRESSLNAFQNETTIEAGLTKLLVQFDYPQDQHGGRVSLGRHLLIRSECRVSQKYVETRLSCSAIPEKLRPDCNVVAQRASLTPHPPENLSILSHPQIFGAISRLVPSVFLAEKETLNYIFNVANLQMIEDPIPATNLSTRLSQAINTFYLVHQISNFMDPLEVPSYEVGVPFLAPAWTVGNATRTDAYYVYLINWPWMVVSLVSCLILVLASIVGVGFVHSGHGPEVLGYVSTAIRDSDIAGLPPQAAQMDGDELSKAMRKRRFRYGRKISEKGPPTVGFGPEEDIIIL